MPSSFFVQASALRLPASPGSRRGDAFASRYYSWRYVNDDHLRMVAEPQFRRVRYAALAERH